MNDEDEQTPAERTTTVEDNSIGRLLTLSDGIFAIAMTLLALDLKVPDLGDNPTEHALVHALAANSNSYFTYLLTFYVVALYWVRHRQVMRSAVSVHPNLVRDTLLLLLCVAAMPFPASLLGRYGGEPISLAVYGAINAVATIAIMLITRDVRRLGLLDPAAPPGRDGSFHWHRWLGLVTFLLCIPAGFVFGHNGPYVLLLLLVPNRVAPLVGHRHRRSRAE